MKRRVTMVLLMAVAILAVSPMVSAEPAPNSTAVAICKAAGHVGVDFGVCMKIVEAKLNSIKKL